MNEQLGRDLVATAVLRGTFRLRSGATSSYYIDKYLFETQPVLLRSLAQALRPLVPAEAQRLAGPVLGAVPLVTALALEMDLPTLFVRPESPRITARPSRSKASWSAAIVCCCSKTW
jgi:orotate phosphoribosyltransferase